MPAEATLTSFPKLHKLVGTALPRGEVSETSLFIRDGVLHAICFNRSASPPNFQIRNMETKALVATHAVGIGFGNILVEGDIIYIAGSTAPGEYIPGNSAVIIQLDSVTYAPGQATTVFIAPVDSSPTPSYAYTIPNVGIGRRPTGELVVAVDFMNRAHGGSEQQRTRFFTASDKVGPWVSLGNPFAPQSQWMGGLKPFSVVGDPHTYFIYIANAGGGQLGYGLPPYYLNIARTLDFVTYQSFEGSAAYPNARLLFPEYAVDAINSSDGSQPVEYRGVTIMNYFAGDQATWSELRTAVYLGTLRQLIREFWP